ncbi:MAG: ribosome hibernation-promoting factor, HPF/YfiA family [Opitutales bacterium]
MKDTDNALILSGTNFSLTGAIKRTVQEKMQKLFDHETKILRLRVDLRRETSSKGGEPQYRAQGIIEIKGPDLVANVSTNDVYKSIDQLEDKLDRMLRRRSRLRVLKRKKAQQVEIPAALPKVEQMSA